MGYIKNFNKINWSIWSVFTFLSFWGMLRAGLGGIIIAVFILPTLLFWAILGWVFYNRRLGKDPNQKIAEYHIIDVTILGISILLQVVAVSILAYGIFNYASTI